MIFLKHVEHKIDHPNELQSIMSHVGQTTAKVTGVRLRDLFILRERDEFILVMECPDEDTYQDWRKICPPPSGAKDWVETAFLPEELPSLVE